MVVVRDDDDDDDDDDIVLCYRPIGLISPTLTASTRLTQASTYGAAKCFPSELPWNW
jgi:hypothetical protein